MRKKTAISVIILLLAFCGIISGVYAQEEQPVPEGYSEMPVEQVYEGTEPQEGQSDPSEQVYDDQAQQDVQNQETQVSGEIPDGTNQDPSQQGDPTQEDQNQNTDQGTEPAPQPEVPVWQDIDEDQLTVLQMLWTEMTETGKAYSGWFIDGDYAPCNWNGISCENRRVTGLVFQNAGYFRTFPQSILSLKDLKSLTFTDTLLKGPLPENLFSELPKLEELEFSGNYLTGELPGFPGVYSPLQKMVISDNLNDDRKTQLSWQPEYSEAASWQPAEYDYPDIDLEPGVDGSLPADWWMFASLYKIDLSGNQLRGAVPDAFSQLALSELDLHGNAEPFAISYELYDALFAASQYNPLIVMDGIQTPVVEEIPEPTAEPESGSEGGDQLPADNIGQDQQDPGNQPAQGTEPEGDPAANQNGSQDGNSGDSMQIMQVMPTEVPYVAPTEVPYVAPTEVPYVAPTEVPYVSPTEVPYVAPTEVPYVPPTEVPYVAPVQPTQVPPTAVPVQPTQVPPTAVPVQPTQVPPTAVPVQPTQVPPTAQTIIIVVTATPVPQQWYTATPPNYNYNPQPYNYPTATPYYQQPYYIYPTATPYTYYNPNWIYPTATSSYSYSYPTYVPNQSSVQVPTVAPTQDQASLLGFTYKMEAMTENNIPMTWRYTGMQEYSIVYLDASGNLYPAFGMEWKPASEICNSSVCNASVSAPEELLQQGKFSLQLQVRDASGRTYQSDPVTMEVSLPAQPEPTPEPEQPKSVFVGFLEWLFGPIIRLFGGGK